MARHLQQLRHLVPEVLNMRIRKLIAGAFALALVDPTYAAATRLDESSEIYFAQEDVPNQGDPNFIGSIIAERARFSAQLATGAGSYGFEEAVAGDGEPLDVTFATGILGGNAAITAKLDQGGDEFLLQADVVTMVAEQKGLAVVGKFSLNGAQDLGKKRIDYVANQHADDVRPLSAQAGGAAVVDIADFFCPQTDLLTGRFSHQG